VIRLLGVDGRGNKVKDGEGDTEEGDSGDEGEDGSEEAIESEDKNIDESEEDNIQDRAARLGTASMRAAKAIEDRALSRSGSWKQETPSRSTQG
jgi:hypothetical protein